MMIDFDRVEQQRFKPHCKMPFCKELATRVILVDGKARGKYCKYHGETMAPTFKHPKYKYQLVNLQTYLEENQKDE